MGDVTVRLACPRGFAHGGRGIADRYPPAAADHAGGALDARLAPPGSGRAKPSLYRMIDRVSVAH